MAASPPTHRIELSPAVRAILEAVGLPRGREGLKIFRRQVNAAIPDEHILVKAVSFDGSWQRSAMALPGRYAA